MKEDINISIIVPCLNSYIYIEECLNSIIKQSLKNIEIICVDAGSDDGTLSIINKFKHKDKRIKLIYSKYKSYGYQMNIGISNAKGKYIGIVESDDYISADMYETLYNLAEKNDVEILKCNFFMFYNNEEARKIIPKRITNKKLYGVVFSPLDNKRVFNSLLYSWAGIYKRDFLIKNHILHNETPGASYQDNGFWFQVLINAKRIMFVQNYLYFYRRDNPNASVRSKEKANCVFEEYDFIRNILCKNKEQYSDFVCQYIYRRYISMKKTLKRIDVSLRKDFIKNFSNSMKKMKNEDNMKLTFFPRKERNKVILFTYFPNLTYHLYKIKDKL